MCKIYNRDAKWKSLNGAMRKVKDMSIGHIWNCINHIRWRPEHPMKDVFVCEIAYRKSNILWTLKRLELLANTIPPTRYERKSW